MLLFNVIIKKFYKFLFLSYFQIAKPMKPKIINVTVSSSNTLIEWVSVNNGNLDIKTINIYLTNDNGDLDEIISKSLTKELFYLNFF